MEGMAGAPTRPLTGTKDIPTIISVHGKTSRSFFKHSLPSASLICLLL
jgi:hypothetical protein